MGSGISLQLTGSKELQEKFNALPGKIQKKLARHAMRTAAKAIQIDAQRIAPDDTGALAKSIKIRAGKRSRTHMSIQIYTDENSLASENGYYAAFTELGTSREAPQPFLRPALEGNRGTVMSLISQDIQDALEESSEESEGADDVAPNAPEHIGPRGGKFRISRSGNKVYHK